MKSPRRVLIAPDKFKGTLTGREAAAAIQAGFAEVFPDAEFRTAVVADGGEGTVEAALAAGGRPHRLRVPGPVGSYVDATWANLDGTAVIELANACGLQYVEAPTPWTARQAHTEGLGHVMRAALDAGARSLLVGLGGSASSDGGVGALRVLGAQFLGADGLEISSTGAEALSDIRSIDLSKLDGRLTQVPVHVVGDVASPLLGESGAAAIFGAQKGADEATIALIEAGLSNLADQLSCVTGRNPASIHWGGAAGGTAGGLYAALGARFELGIDRVAEFIDLARHLEWADVAVIGEGSLDAQSLRGKAPYGVMRLAAELKVEVVAVAGHIELTPSEMDAAGIMAWHAADKVAPDRRAALGVDSAKWVARAASRAARTFAERRCGPTR